MNSVSNLNSDDLETVAKTLEKKDFLSSCETDYESSICIRNEDTHRAKSNHDRRMSISIDKNEDYMSKFLRVLETREDFNCNSHVHLNNTSLNKTKPTDLFMKNLLDLHKPLKSSNILPKTNYSSMFTTSLNQTEASYHIISSLINDKIYQLYNTHSEDTLVSYERAKKLVEKGTSVFGENSPDTTLEKVRANLIQSIPGFVKSVILFAKEVPGLNELNETDFATIINNKLFDFFVIMNSILFINGESYLYLPNNVHYSRYWLNKIKGKATTDALFEFVTELNELGLTNKEKALLIVLVFTMPDLEISDQANLNDLNEYYTRSILYEFDLSKRDSLFLKKFKKVNFFFFFLLRFSILNFF